MEKSTMAKFLIIMEEMTIRHLILNVILYYVVCKNLTDNESKRLNDNDVQIMHGLFMVLLLIHVESDR